MFKFNDNDINEEETISLEMDKISKEIELAKIKAGLQKIFDPNNIILKTPGSIPFDYFKQHFLKAIHLGFPDLNLVIKHLGDSNYAVYEKVKEGIYKKITSYNTRYNDYILIHVSYFLKDYFLFRHQEYSGLIDYIESLKEEYMNKNNLNIVF